MPVIERLARGRGPALDRHVEGGGRAGGARRRGASFVNDVTALRGDPGDGGGGRRVRRGRLPDAHAGRAAHDAGRPALRRRRLRGEGVPRGAARVRRRLRASPRSGSGSTRASASARRWSTTSSCCARLDEIVGPRPARGGRGLAEAVHRRAHRASRRPSACRAAWRPTCSRSSAGPRCSGSTTSRPPGMHCRRRRDRAGCYLGVGIEMTDAGGLRRQGVRGAGGAGRGSADPDSFVTVEISGPVALHPPRRHRGRAGDRPAAGLRHQPRRRGLRRHGHRPARGHDRLRRRLPGRRAAWRPSAPTAPSSGSAPRSPTCSRSASARRGRGARDQARAADPAAGRGGLGRGLALSRDAPLPRARLERRRPARQPARGGRARSTRIDGDRGGRRARRSTRPSRSARCSTSPTSTTRSSRIGTDLEPLELLAACKAIERELGREPGGAAARAAADRRRRAAGRRPRRSSRSASSCPHPEVRSRRFVLVPLLELDPELRCRTARR